MSYGKRLLQARSEKGWSQARLAQESGVKQASISKIERGDQETSSFDVVFALANALHVDAAWLAQGAQDGVFSVHLQDPRGVNLSVAETATHYATGIPVVGTAQLGDGGYWTDTGHPPGIGDGAIKFSSADPNAYALRVFGDSMTPRIRHGEYVIVEPAKEYHPGDEVLVTTDDGRSMVKIYLYERDGRIHLDSLNNGHGQIVLPVESIKTIHYVAGIAKKSLYIDD